MDWLSRHFRNLLYIIYSAHPDAPNMTGRVSIAVSKAQVDVRKVIHQTMVEGRIMMVELPWSENYNLHIMNIYAPVRGSHGGQGVMY